MSKYRAKPIVVEAFRLGFDNWPDWLSNRIKAGTTIVFSTTSNHNNHDIHVVIEALNGTLYADFGDYIIKGAADEIYTCKPDILNKAMRDCNDRR